MKVFVDACKMRKGFLICYTDMHMRNKEIVYLPNCTKSHLAEEEAVVLASKAENVETIWSDSQAAVDKLSAAYPNILVEKIPRSANIANQVLAIYKEQCQRKYHDNRNAKNTSKKSSANKPK